jgi:predicted ATPase/class 3 adenylate cyclase
MKCPKCRSDNREGIRFCEECGAKLELECPDCHAKIPLDKKFCGECGYDLSKSTKLASLETNEHEIRISETPPEETKTTPIPAEGERKHVTVLFSDLTGYTTMSEKLDPEEVKEITSRIFGEISKIVSKYDGFIEKYAGDAVMAIFGVPQAHEDDPVRAIKAAREIHRFVESISPQYEDKIGQPLQMHTGINTGLVVTGELNLGKGIHGVVGDTINVAARISSAANPGEILVDHATYTRTEGYFRFENLEPIQLKGKTKAVQVYRFLSTKKQPQKIHRLHGLRAELIGRKAEMAQLSDAVENLSQGKASFFSIIGAAGTGKSRLVEEFKASLDLDNIQWREGNAFAYAQNIPYFPLIDLISKAIQIYEGDSTETVKEKLESSLEVLIGEKQDIAPYIGSLYSLKYPEIEEVSPEFWKRKLQKAILMVLTALAQRVPTIVCLEDLHWADPSTIELVNFLLSEIRHPVLFLCVYRPIISPFSTHQTDAMAIPHQELHLGDLSLSGAQNMVESLLKTVNLPKELQRFIRDKVEGNPFYLEEAINSLIESKILVSQNGNWKVTGPITESEISATIQGVISARVDRLELESKRILQEASVIGRSFYYEILKRISKITDDIDRSLSGLERFDLIKTKTIQPYLEYIFKHALTQEVVYNGLLKKERREIHERIGHVIEGLFKDRLPEFYETLAFHFKRSRSVFKAVGYLMKSGEKCLKRYAVDESHIYYKEAFELLSSKSERSKEKDELLIDLLIDWSSAFYYRGDFKELTNLLSNYEEVALSLSDKAKLGLFYAWLGFMLNLCGKTKTSYEYLLSAIKLGEEADDKKVISYAITWIATTCVDLGLIDDAVAYGERAYEISKNLHFDQFQAFMFLSALGRAHSFKGDWKKTSELGETMLKYGHQYSNVRSVAGGYWLIGMSKYQSGDLTAAIECSKKGLQVSRDPFISQILKVAYGGWCAIEGRLQEAQDALNEVLAFSQKFGAKAVGLPAKLFLGLVLIAKGNISVGLRMMEDAKKEFLENHNKAYYSLAEYLIGKVFLNIVAGNKSVKPSILLKNIGFLIKNVPFASKKAEAHFKNAIATSKEAGGQSLLGQAYLDLGLLHKAKKRVDKAKDCISEAIQIFEEIEAEKFLKQAKEAMTSLK